MWSTRWLRSGVVAAILVVVAMPPTQAHSAPAPISVQLARHQFDALTPPAAVIAYVEASSVGWNMPEEGPRYGPGSFAVSADGQAWLLDTINRRLLGWSAGRWNQPDQIVPAPAGAADFARAANGTFYFTTFAPGGRPQLVAASADGTERWRLPLHEDLFNAQLHWGPNGVLYQVTPQAWIPVVGSDGIALTAAQQSRKTLNHQPLSDTNACR